VHFVGDSFVRWGLGHLTMLAVTVVGSVLLIVVGRRIRGSRSETVLSQVFAATLFAVAAVHVVHGLLPGNFRLQGSIPLQLSDVLRFLSAYALLTRRFWATSVVYYWGLTFNPQALITPNLHYTDSPVYDFSMYWSLHIFVLWAAIYLTWGLGHSPNWRSYRIAIGATLAWAVVAFTFNVLAGTNYGFLNARPASASLLDLMGDWPVYLLTAFVAMFVVWALITLPWMVRRRPVTRDRSEAPASPG
jgi:hypothetical integral membrane protein (TIGR02206 family)